ncbi:MAG: hypothetical protein GY791_09200 [Alphaproteobacteria bacterium]|nr:hypothetical protein [Alphaproteobacteria bacterium]
MTDKNLHLEFVDEALRLVRDAEERGIQLRILGSIAYRLQCPKNLHLFDDMARVLTDVDFGAMKRQNNDIRQFMISQGYQPDEGVYVASEGSRHIYLHPETKLNVDVFADELYFCHCVPFRGRLGIDTPTISTTDLLLEKMQIVEINLKDFKDTLVLMLEHPLGSAADSNKHIDADYVVDIMSKDWGFYYTFTTNLRRVPDYIPEFPAITEDEGKIIRARIDDLLNLIESAPKSLKWKVRAKVGTRKLWYQEVTEKSDQY